MAIPPLSSTFAADALERFANLVSATLVSNPPRNLKEAKSRIEAIALDLTCTAQSWRDLPDLADLADDFLQEAAFEDGVCAPLDAHGRASLANLRSALGIVTTSEASTGEGE